MRSEEATNGRLEVLVAEDSPTQAEQLAHLLEQHGFAVTTAANGRETLAALERRLPAVVISDIVMPEMDGYGLCKAIRANPRTKEVPVILLTTLSDAVDVIRGLECGADNFIRKPYDEKYLVSRIKYLLMNLELRKNQRMQMGVEIALGGQKHFITAERQQILDLLISTYEQAVLINGELETRERELAQSNEVLNGLYQIAEGLNHAVSEREVAETTLERALALPGIQAGWISLREGASGFRIAAVRNLPPALAAPGALAGDCLCRRQLLSGELNSVTNILECERLAKARVDGSGLRYHATVPLWVGELKMGMLNLAGPGAGLFDEKALKVLYSVGNQVAVAFERARLHEHMEQLVEERTAALTAEIAQRQRSEEALRRLNRMYAVLSGINTAIVRVQEQQRLFEQACRIAVEEGGFSFAWIGTLHAGSQEVTPVARAGRDDGYLSQIYLTADEMAPGNCELTARALAQVVPVVCNDIAADDRMLVWRPAALARGYRSVVVLPLVLGDRPAGVFVLYAPEPGAFDEAEMRLLVETASDISFALEHIEKERLLEQQTIALTAEIAERRRIEQDQARLVAILEATPDLVWTGSPDGRVLFCNQAGRRMLGLEPGEDLSARRFPDFSPEWAAKLMAEVGIPYAIEHGSWSGDTAFRGRDGREIPVSQVIVAHKGEDGAVDYLSTIARDVSDKIERDHRTARAQRLESIGTLAGGIAHDLNNSLAPVLMGTELLRSQLDAEHHELLELVESSTRRAANMVRQLLTFSKGTEGERGLVSPSELLGELGTLLRSTFPKNIEFRLPASGRLPDVVGDRTQLHQVLLNLCVNARDAMPDGGELELEVTIVDVDPAAPERASANPRGSHLRIRVRDTGQGIPAEILDRVVEPFFSTKSPDLGTGLGLSTSLGIVRSHGGLLHLASEVGKGTTVDVLLPLAGPGAVRIVRPKAAKDLRGKGELVLVVDDEPALRNLIQALLERAGWRVLVASGGDEAVRIGGEQGSSLEWVLCDQQMPEMDGLQVLRALRPLCRQARFVAMSGYSDAEQLAALRAAGVTGFLAKPFDRRALIAAMARAAG